MKKKLKIIIISILVAAFGFVAGNYVGQKFLSNESQNIDAEEELNIEQVAEGGESSSNTSNNSNRGNEQPPSSVEVPEELPVPPGEDAPQEEQERFRSIINSASIVTNTIEIKGECEVEPRVAEISGASTLIVKNTDSESHTFNIFDEGRLVEPESQIEIKINESRGLFGFGCDTQRSQGFIRVISSE